MILTKSPISLHNPAGPNLRMAPGLRFLCRFSPLFPRNPFFPPSGPATGFFNGFHPKSKFLAI